MAYLILLRKEYGGRGVFVVRKKYGRGVFLSLDKNMGDAPIFAPILVLFCPYFCTYFKDILVHLLRILARVTPLPLRSIVEFG